LSELRLISRRQDRNGNSLLSQPFRVASVNKMKSPLVFLHAPLLHLQTSRHPLIIEILRVICFGKKIPAFRQQTDILRYKCGSEQHYGRISHIDGQQ
jgi:hypothetical protein